VAIVVSDTSAIAALVHLRLAHVLRSLFAEVFVPPAVAHELKNPRGPRPVVDVGQLPFIRVQAPADAGRVARLRADLDAGESEAIAPAIELAADWILIDEDTAEGWRWTWDYSRPVSVASSPAQSSLGWSKQSFRSLTDWPTRSNFASHQACELKLRSLPANNRTEHFS